MNQPNHPTIAITLWPCLNAKLPGQTHTTTFADLVNGLREPAQYRGKWTHPGWSPGHFDPPLRRAANMRAMHLLGLDYDGDSGATVGAALAYWQGVTGFLYTTKSHAPQGAHRFRVMLLLSRPVDGREYRRLWLLADSMLREEGHKIDGQAKDAARFWYAPGTETGAPHELHELTGTPLNVDEWLAQAPDLPPVSTGAFDEIDEQDAPEAVLTAARAYLGAMPPAISGQGGHPMTFRAAVALVRGFGLSRAQALAMLQDDYNPRCAPAWTTEELRHKVEGAHANSTKPWGYLRQRPTIRLGVDLYRVLNDATAALAQAKTLYQTTGKLVRVVRVEEADETSKHATAGTPVISPQPLSMLHAHLTEIARWESFDNRSRTWVPREPTKQVIQALADMMEWPGVQPIAGLTEVPVMRVDGSILDKPGYDPTTGYLYLSQGVFEPIQDAPSRIDAAVALNELSEVFADFPFKTRADRFVPIAALLTLVARPAITGNVPLFAIDAPLKGTGKTLMIDAISVIATGRPSYKLNWTGQDDEQEKQLSSYARTRAAIVNFDNAATPIKGAAIERVLTSRGRVALRVLGSSTIEEHVWKPVLFVSGNQLKIASDMTRRTIKCRMVPADGKPSERSRAQFKHQDLLAFCTANRERLIDAALTLLRGYVVAGRPAIDQHNRGGFEEWIDLIAASIRWAGGPDVLACWQHDEDNEDTTDAHETLLDYWATRWPAGTTAREALAELQSPAGNFAEARKRDGVLDAARILCGATEKTAVGPRELGHALSSLREIFLRARAFDRAKTTATGTIWIVRRNDDAEGATDAAAQ